MLRKKLRKECLGKSAKFLSDEGKLKISFRENAAGGVWAQRNQTLQDGGKVYFAWSDWAYS